MLDRRSIRARPWHLWHGREPLRGNKEKENANDVCVRCVFYVVAPVSFSISSVAFFLLACEFSDFRKARLETLSVGGLVLETLNIFVRLSDQ